MARGWESKSVEAQQADHSERQDDRRAPLPEDPARAARRRTLELARARAAADLAAATNPAYRRMLETALRALDAELEHAR
jgi:hypothetical protein